MTYSDSFTENTTPLMENVELTVQQESEVEPKPTVEELSAKLIGLASYTHQMYIQSHLIHLNVEGPLFLSIHELLKDQYELHIKQFDSLSELVRSLDYFMPMCAKGLQQSCNDFKNVKTYEMRDMLTTYLNNLDNGGMTAKEVLHVAKEVDAPDVENYLAEYIGDSFKSAWFLKATLRC
jgi:DNA-binding ferritin-like protein